MLAPLARRRERAAITEPTAFATCKRRGPRGCSSHQLRPLVGDDERVVDLERRLEVQSYRDRAAENLKLAENAQIPEVRERYLKIAHHYLELAEMQERSARQAAGHPGDH